MRRGRSAVEQPVTELRPLLRTEPHMNIIIILLIVLERRGCGPQPQAVTTSSVRDHRAVAASPATSAPGAPHAQHAACAAQKGAAAVQRQASTPAVLPPKQPLISTQSGHLPPPRTERTPPPQWPAPAAAAQTAPRCAAPLGMPRRGACGATDQPGLTSQPARSADPAPRKAIGDHETSQGRTCYMLASVALACKRPLSARLAMGVGLSLFLSRCDVLPGAARPPQRARPAPPHLRATASCRALPSSATTASSSPASGRPSRPVTCGHQRRRTHR
jgi:hypothetical protein